jgi:hypothetical protein
MGDCTAGSAPRARAQSRSRRLLSPPCACILAEGSVDDSFARRPSRRSRGPCTTGCIASTAPQARAQSKQELERGGIWSKHRF